ncbi:APC family permease [Bacillus cereus]|nr:APC family permease [Bacillus cereus]
MNEQHLHRSLSLRQLIIYGMVSMSPLAPFQVYGMVTNQSFGMAPLVYFIGMILMFFTALSYAQFSKEFLHAGSVYTFVSKGVNPHVGFVAGWTLLADYILAPGLVYSFAGLWMSGLVPGVNPVVWSLFFVLVNTIINVNGIEVNAKVNNILFYVQLIGLVVFVGLAIKYVFVDGHGTGGFSLAPLFQPEHIDWKFFATVISITVMGFMGFDCVSTLSEESKNPKKHIPLATVGSLICTGLLFLVLTYVATLAHPNHADLNEEMALFDIAKEIGGNGFFQFMIIVNVLSAGVATTLNIQSAVSRIMYAMGRDNILPFSGFFAKLHSKHDTPVNSIITAGVISTIIILVGSIPTVLMFINFGAVTSFTVLNMAVIYYFFFKKKQRGIKGFLLHVMAPMVGILVCGYVWTGFDMLAYGAGFSWVFVGIVIGAIKSKGYKIVPKIENM